MCTCASGLCSSTIACRWFCIRPSAETWGPMGGVLVGTENLLLPLRRGGSLYPVLNFGRVGYQSPAFLMGYTSPLPLFSKLAA